MFPCFFFCFFLFVFFLHASNILYTQHTFCSKCISTALEETPTAKPKVNALRNDHHATLPKMPAPVKISIYHESLPSPTNAYLQHSLELHWENVSEKRNVMTWQDHPAQSPGQTGWQRIHIKDRLLFSHHTMPSLQSNGPHWMNSITHTVISYCHCRVRGDSHVGIQFYHSAPSKSGRESEIVEKYSPQDKCDWHFKYRICYSVLSHCWPCCSIHSQFSF